jgi:hypothetical protein
VNAEFQWWLLILGIVIGGSLVYLVLADLQGDREVDEAESDDLALDEPWDDTDGVGEDPDDLGEGADDLPRWAPPAASAVPATRTSARDDADVQRDGAQGETSVADLP